MATRTLDNSPSIIPLYLRAAAPMIPGASLLPFIPGRGKEVPDIELTLAGISPDPDDVAAYAKVCGFSLRDELPPTYPHVLAFPMHMAIMADGSFPFGAVGLVHIENRIVQHRPIGIGEELTLRVKPTQLEPHPRGKAFSLVTEVSVGEELVWGATSTMLRRGGGQKQGEGSDAKAKSGEQPAQGNGRRQTDAIDHLAVVAEWKLGGDLGRRYASVSGDRNPIHMHSLTAKPLGFPSAIAHGMWSKARCLAALESRLPDAFSVDVRFRKPILLPSRVEFLSGEQGNDIAFAVRNAKKQTPHLDGVVMPVEAKQTSGRKAK